MLEKTAFNAPDGQPYQLLQLTNSNGMTVQFMDWEPLGFLVKSQ